MRVLCLVSLLALTALAYQPVLHNGFVYEDHSYLPDLQTDAAPSRWLSGWHLGPNRAFGLATLRANRWISEQPWSWHLTSVGWHLLNGLVLWLLIARIAEPHVALLATAIFLLAPIQTEAVAYLAGRTELVMTTGVLIALLGVTQRRLSLACGLIVVGSALALGGKETGIVVFGLVALAVWCRAPRWLIEECGAMLVAACVVLTLVASWGVLRSNPIAAGVQQPFLGFLSIQALALWRLLVFVIWPVGLSIDHDYDLIPHVWAVLALGAGLLTLLAAVLVRNRFPRLAFTVAWVAISLAPRFLVPAQGEFLNEHQLYLPMAGIAFGLASGLVWLDARLSTKGLTWQTS